MGGAFYEGVIDGDGRAAAVDILAFLCAIYQVGIYCKTDMLCAIQSAELIGLGGASSACDEAIEGIVSQIAAIGLSGCALKLAVIDQLALFVVHRLLTF